MTESQFTDRQAIPVVEFESQPFNYDDEPLSNPVDVHSMTGVDIIDHEDTLPIQSEKEVTWNKNELVSSDFIDKLKEKDDEVAHRYHDAIAAAKEALSAGVSKIETLNSRIRAADETAHEIARQNIAALEQLTEYHLQAIRTGHDRAIQAIQDNLVERKASISATKVVADIVAADIETSVHYVVDNANRGLTSRENNIDQRSRAIEKLFVLHGEKDKLKKKIADAKNEITNLNEQIDIHDIQLVLDNSQIVDDDTSMEQEKRDIAKEAMREIKNQNPDIDAEVATQTFKEALAKASSDAIKIQNLRLETKRGERDAVAMRLLKCAQLRDEVQRVMDNDQLRLDAIPAEIAQIEDELVNLLNYGDKIEKHNLTTGSIANGIKAIEAGEVISELPKNLQSLWESFTRLRDTLAKPEDSDYSGPWVEPDYFQGSVLPSISDSEIDASQASQELTEYVKAVNDTLELYARLRAGQDSELDADNPNNSNTARSKTVRNIAKTILKPGFEVKFLPRAETEKTEG